MIWHIRVDRIITLIRIIRIIRVIMSVRLIMVVRAKTIRVRRVARFIRSFRGSRNIRVFGAVVIFRVISILPLSCVSARLHFEEVECQVESDDQLKNEGERAGSRIEY